MVRSALEAGVLELHAPPVLETGAVAFVEGLGGSAALCVFLVD